ncbi:MAG: NFACT RNA binding domain-containing protein [Campylobacterota bacterium]
MNMKYFLLEQVVEYLDKNAHKIKQCKRIDNNTIIIEFNNSNIVYFDMTKGNSKVFKSKNELKSKKDFNAPFDIVLQKRFNNSKVKEIKLYNSDKIINIDVISTSSYKELKTTLQLEFTGKNTNIVILDENRVILEALRHIDEFSSIRVVKVGIKLDEIPKNDFKFEKNRVENIEKYLYETYEQMQQKNLKNIKNQKINQIQKKVKKLTQTLNSLPKKEDLKEQSTQLYEKANLILASLHDIKPYQKELKTFDYEGKEVVIKLKESSTISNYTNELFNKARKAKQKAANISLEKDNLNQKVAFLEKMIQNLKSCNSIDECEFLVPKKQRNKTKTVKSQPYESFFYEGYKIMLGRSQRENIYLLENSKASDFWFHLKDTPSCHVIVQNTKKQIPDSIIQEAAKLCAKFSIASTGTYEVDFTQRRNVKIQSGANVLYNPYSTVVVKI